MDGQQNLPSCFAKMWSASDAECAGGLDVNYTNPKTGSRIRDRCNFFESCGAKSQAALLPARQLIRPYTPPTAFDILSSSDRLAKQIDPPRPQPQPIVPAPVTHPVPPRQETMAYGMPVGYAAMVPMPSQMPGYLSVPEYHDPRESIWSTLSRELLRGALKSIGHSLAHFIDTTPLRKPPA